ncbi:hypothetical protein KYX44_000616 [Listeria monocytogenes]|nr:hypothetical protein [Listeria monocytogenes]
MDKKHTCNYADLVEGDIVSLKVYDSFCGLPEGNFQGLVVRKEQESDLIIMFTDVSLSIRADELGVAPFLSKDSTEENCEITRLYHSQWYEN